VAGTAKPTVRSCRVGGCIGDSAAGIRADELSRRWARPPCVAKQPRYFPAQGPSGSHGLFHLAGGEPGARDRGSARSAGGPGQLYLGKACSVVGMRATDATPEPNYAPDAAGDRVLRVPSRDGSKNWPGCTPRTSGCRRGRRHGTGGWTNRGPNPSRRARSSGKWRSSERRPDRVCPSRPL